MFGFGRALGRGVAAGAAGTTALNAAAYVDMAVRARGSSDMPERAVEQLAHQVGQEIPGEGEARTNRLQGLGALAGILTGVSVGVAAAMLGPVMRRLPAPLAGLLVGGLAMAATDLPLQRLGLTNTSTWSSEDWLSDAIPHLAYGVTTAATLRAFTPHT